MVSLTEEHRAIEAVLLCAVEPVPSSLLAELIEGPVEQVEALCTDLATDYAEQNRGFQLVRIAGGYRLQTDPDLAQFVERFATEGISTRLSSAALETLAVIAYRQPVSRAQVAAIRGVNVDGVVTVASGEGLHRPRRAGSRPRSGRPLRDDCGLPGEAGPRHGRAAASCQRPAAHCRSRRGARGEPEALSRRQLSTVG